MNKFDDRSPWGKWKPRGIAKLSFSMIDRLPVNGLSRRLAFIFRKPVKNGRQPIFDREIWGLRLRLALKGNLTEQRWLTMPNFHDKAEREALDAHLTADSTLLDIGANAGFYTFWALSLDHSNLRVLAVEPTAIMLERLRYNLRQNQLEQRVRLFPYAITATHEDVFVDAHSENIGQSGINSQCKGSKVRGVPLLDLLQEAGVDQVDAMKIDIEGMENPVLDAFFARAPNSLWPKMIIAETVGDCGARLRESLQAKGYKLEQQTKMNGIFRIA